MNQARDAMNHCKYLIGDAASVVPTEVESIEGVPKVALSFWLTWCAFTSYSMLSDATRRLSEFVKWNRSDRSNCLRQIIKRVSSAIQPRYEAHERWLQQRSLGGSPLVGDYPCVKAHCRLKRAKPSTRTSAIAMTNTSAPDNCVKMLVWYETKRFRTDVSASQP
jgi:hypothetical protein